MLRALCEVSSLTLDLKPNVGDRPIVSRMKKTLLSRFRPNSENDIELALRLAHYLMVLGELEESKAFLESFLYFDEGEKDENHEHLWFFNSYGILLLALIELALNNQDKCACLCNLVEVSEYFRVDKNDHYYEELTDLHDDYEFHIKDYINETHKFRCQVLSQLYLNYLFFSMLPKLTLGFDRSVMDTEFKIIKKNMDSLHSLLKDELENKK